MLDDDSERIKMRIWIWTWITLEGSDNDLLGHNRALSQSLSQR